MHEIWRFFFNTTLMCVAMAIISAGFSAYAFVSTDAAYWPSSERPGKMVPVDMYLLQHPVFPVFFATGFSYQLLRWERTCRKSEEWRERSARWYPETRRIDPPKLYKLVLSLLTAAMVFHTYQALRRAFAVLEWT